MTPGKVLSLARLPGAQPIQGRRGRLSTKAAPRRGRRKKPARGPIRPVRLRAILEAPSTAQVAATTPRGRFSFVLSEVPLGREAAYLDGAASVRRTPAARRLTQTATDDDFPAVGVGADGAVWCAFVAYNRGTPIDVEKVRKGSFDSLVANANGDQVKLMRYANGRWSPPMPVTRDRLTVWRPSVAVGARGRVWVFWSQHGDDNWDLHCRVYDPGTKAWGKVRRLTASPGTDANVVAAADAAGRGVWVAWQGWRDGNFDILLARAAEVPVPDRLERPVNLSIMASSWVQGDNT